MAIKNNLIQEFLQSHKEVKDNLLLMQFEEHSYLEKGMAHFIKYKRDSTIVEFLFGPPEFQIEMIIFTSSNKYAFRDLLGIPLIADWVNNNRYIQKGERSIHDEMLWFIELLKFSLSVIETDK